MNGWVTSNAVVCRYCRAHTILAAERYDSDQKQLENIWEFATHNAFSDPERAAVSFALAASVIPNAVNENIKT